MKITTRTAMDLVNALSALNGHPRTAKAGDRQTTEQEPYQFKPEIRAAIAKNLAKLNALIEAYHKVRQGLVLQITGGNPNPEAPPLADRDKPDYAERKAKFDRLNAEYDKVNQFLLVEPHQLELITLRDLDLDLKTNPIPVNVLAGLAPIMAGDDWAVPEQFTFPEYQVAPPPAPSGHTGNADASKANGHTEPASAEAAHADAA